MASPEQQFPEWQDPRLRDFNFRSIPTTAVDTVAAMYTDLIKRQEFEHNYMASDLLIDKYRLARDLVIDGRFPDPKFLLQKFLVHKEVPERYIEISTLLRDRLHFLLIQKGVYSHQSMDNDTAERFIRDELHRRENFQDLLEAGWPIEVLGQLMTVDLFTDISDAKKVEELRGWTTRSLMREYLGVLSSKRARKELSITDMLDRVPNRVFADPRKIKMHLVDHYIEARLMQSITDLGINNGILNIEGIAETTQDPDKRNFLLKLSNRFWNIATHPYRGDFKSTILLKDQEKQFPSFEQMAFWYDFLQYSTRLLTAAPGMGKTGAAYGALENTDAEKVLVIAPASGKATWAIEDQKLFQSPGNIFIIDGATDIEKAIKSGKKYIVISQELLGLTDHDPKLNSSLTALVEQTNIEGAIIDEIDNLSRPKNVSTKTTIRLLEKIRENYKKKERKQLESAPVIGLTATPIRSKLSNMNTTMGILYPDEYAISQTESTKSKKTFSDTHLNRPDLAFYTLIGEKKMFRWEQATGVQDYSYEIIPLEISPFEEYLYTFIANEVPIDSLTKIRVLEDSLCNPLLVKAEVRHFAKDRIPPFDLDQTMDRLKQVVQEWKVLRDITEPHNSQDYLSASKLVELGFGDMVLGCFFSDLLENGIDTLVDELTRDATDESLIELRKFWQPHGLSTKYSVIKKMVEESLTPQIDNDGKQTREKLFIVSPSRKQGRTRDVHQRLVQIENGQKTALYAPYELSVINDTALIKLLDEWVSTYGKKMIIIDGNVTVGRARDNAIVMWTNDPDTELLATLEAAYQSRDFTLNITEEQGGTRISKVRKILLAPPYHDQQLRQIHGRSNRWGQLVPADLQIFQVKDLLDQGKAEAVYYTYLLSRMALSGIVLSADEQTFFDSKRVGNKIRLQSPESRYLRDVLSFIKSAGEEETEVFNNKPSPLHPEKIQGQLFADLFFKNGKDEFSTTGYNAELIAFLAKYFIEANSNVLDIGAGTLLLQRKLKKGIDNVDMNPYMMEAGWGLASRYGGRKIVAKASLLSEDICPSNNYNFVNCAFTLPWSKLNGTSPDSPESSERVKILSQIHRVLKLDGLFVLTVSEKSFDEKTFENFILALEQHFGFQVDRELSGMSFGRNKMGVSKRLGWCIVAKKIDQINLENLSLQNLEFADENGKWISYGKKKKRKEKSVKVAGKDYPLPDLEIQFDQYEIVNNQKQIKVITYKDKFIDNPTLPSSGDGHVDGNMQNVKETSPLEVIKGETKADYHYYRTNLLRPVMELTGYSWEQAEELCAIILNEIGIRQKREHTILLVLKEVKKRVFNNHK
ncbi:hypothetical protein A2861_01945 [Candidatus Roizmanbacteria bacterium RIFCSPHIGHO2_01_FULL_38_15]|nr:MAG: hypothetical protein A2861_01945 [Candidatus Roizmanbacteria bacterium RIFCSPHIGHO2_01_FULL_38_15]OGK35495.1 MAG: hypothetical protein A3F59_00975 [Candidatus Roizmanbacteria bacterium RIFCSPHIGHO2_12_FULL_38_13]